MAKTNKLVGFDIYSNKSRIKWIVLAVSILISAGSIFYTNLLVNQLQDKERRQIQVFAKALEYTVNETQNSNLYFITEEILFQNNSIPTILVDQSDSIISYRNIDVKDLSANDLKKKLNAELAVMRGTYDPIEIKYRDKSTNEIYDTQYIFYQNSFLLTQLTYYPYVQLSVIALFAFISYMAFNYSKAAEQNQVWVGLAKETAHQLGTPISSLMAWMEYFKEDDQFKDKSIIDELDKDIRKLQVITERFSNIGSTPVLNSEAMEPLIKNIIAYLKPRISPKVSISVLALTPDIMAKVNPPLFEWVIENLCKNAVDAMNGSGAIFINILKGSEGRVFVDIADNGKGIPKSKLKHVFNPGFTTKKRGWGLGLTLAKRIIEIYHQGKISIKSSEESQGTTFRIVLHN
ncbi:MAG TPA: HAMP domain-containing sensor histidine kinase [Fulvivirga sp.]|nr:HAMP domain-containing sensor histidine kinase [Fulvivirga sp.]